MSEDEELMRLREARMRKMQQESEENSMDQAIQQAQYQQEMERQKEMLLMMILDAEARSRLNTIKLARPEFAQNVEMQLIQLYSAGRLRGHTPLSDDQFKEILKQLQSSQQRDFKIKFK